MTVAPEITKVAHVLRRFNPDKWGGTETVVTNLSRELMRDGVESPLFCTDMFAKPGPDTFAGIPIRRFPYVYPWFGLAEEAKHALDLKGGNALSPALLRALRREPGLSLIHAHVQHRLGGIARTVARWRRIPYVVSIHGGQFAVPDAEIREMTAPFAGKFEWGRAAGLFLGARRVLKDAQAIVCVGRDEYARVCERFPDKRVRYVPNGVRVAEFSAADGALFRKAHGFGPLDRLVTCISRIDYQKNQLMLVRAFARFAAERPEWILVLVGPVTAEAYHRKLLAEIDAVGIAQRVRIVPGLAPDDPMLPSAFAAADVFCLPTMHEPFGIVILEAWAAGTPVIATRVGGIPGFAVHENDCLLVESDNHEELAHELARLADHRELAQRLVARASDKVATQFDWTVIARQVRNVYEEVLGLSADGADRDQGGTP